MLKHAVLIYTINKHEQFCYTVTPGDISLLCVNIRPLSNFFEFSGLQPQTKSFVYP